MHLKFLTRWIKHFTSQEVVERGAFEGCILGECNCCNLAHLSVRSFLNKMDNVRSIHNKRFDIHNKRFDNFTFSETWLNPSIKDSELNIPGYTLVRLDRTGKRCGGTAINVRNNIPYKHRQDLSAENIESSWIEVNRLKCKKLFVGCVNRPPNTCSDMLIDLLNDSRSFFETADWISNCPVRRFQY